MKQSRNDFYWLKVWNFRFQFNFGLAKFIICGSLKTTYLVQNSIFKTFENKVDKVERKSYLDDSVSGLFYYYEKIQKDSWVPSYLFSPLASKSKLGQTFFYNCYYFSRIVIEKEKTKKIKVWKTFFFVISIILWLLSVITI